ncbi:MAG: hypothetical protein K9H25_14635 [Rhodospirillum sp.]|nr:hypothetical protein [Rhodospirillum sp.]MCF8491246.1 hypothetical protein [Rhodospirillum sp.]MCF8500778.1 hypothetical protein [Rhodospirillum sp.]
MPLATSLGIVPVRFGVIVRLNQDIGQRKPTVASVPLMVCSVVNEAVTFMPWTALVL